MTARLKWYGWGREGGSAPARGFGRCEAARDPQVNPGVRVDV